MWLFMISERSPIAASRKHQKITASDNVGSCQISALIFHYIGFLMIIGCLIFFHIFPCFTKWMIYTTLTSCLSIFRHQLESKGDQVRPWAGLQPTPSLQKKGQQIASYKSLSLSFKSFCHQFTKFFLSVTVCLVCLCVCVWLFLACAITAIAATRTRLTAEVDS